MIRVPQLRDRRAAGLASTLLFGVMALALVLTWFYLHEQWRRGVEAQVEIAADQAAMRLENYVGDRLLAIMALAQPPLGAADGGTDAFTRSAIVLQRRFGGFQALNWIDPEGVIRIVTPLDANRGALGRSVLDHPVAQHAFRAVRQTGKPSMTYGLELFQGGRGFASYIPQYLNGEQVGYFNGVFRIQPLVDASLRGRLLEGYSLSITDDSGAVLREATVSVAQAPGRPSGSAVLSIFDRQWHLTLVPHDRLWADMLSTRSDGVFVMALLLSGLMAWLVNLTLCRQIERIESERERHELKLQLQRNAKMDALGRLAGGVAHDFSNILTAVNFNAELIAHERSANADVVRRVDDILDACQRARELTMQLTNFSRPAEADLVTLDLNAQLRDMTRMLESLLHDKASLSVACCDGEALIRASSAHIGQIVVNLAVNASDAMPDGGHLVVATHVDDASVILTVTDTGHGMDSETVERVFEPFFTTKAKGSGTGLGMATVFALVQQHEGAISIESTPGRGTCFTIRFPRVPG